MACSKLLGFFTNSIIRVINVDYINLYLLRKRVQFYIIVILHYYATYNNLVSPFKILIRHVDLKVKIACYHRASTTPICISFSFSLYVICIFHTKNVLSLSKIHGRSWEKNRGRENMKF